MLQFSGEEKDYYDFKKKSSRELLTILLNSGVEPISVLAWLQDTVPIFKKKLIYDYVEEMKEQGVLEDEITGNDGSLNAEKEVIPEVQVYFSSEVMFDCDNECLNIGNKCF